MDYFFIKYRQIEIIFGIWKNNFKKLSVYITGIFIKI